MKRDILKLDLRIGDDQILGAGLFPLLRLQVEQCVDHLGVDDRAVDLHLQLGKSPGRVIGHQKCCHEGEEAPGGTPP